MKAKDVLKALGISRRTLTRWVKNGNIKVIKLSNGQYDYDEASVKSLERPRISEFDVMMRVCELGLLRANKQELARLEGYKKCWDMYNDGELNIKPNGIYARIYNAPLHLSNDEVDITYTVIFDLYGTNDDWDEFIEEIICHEYDELKELKLKGE